MPPEVNVAVAEALIRSSTNPPMEDGALSIISWLKPNTVECPF